MLCVSDFCEYHKQVATEWRQQNQGILLRIMSNHVGVRYSKELNCLLTDRLLKPHVPSYRAGRMRLLGWPACRYHFRQSLHQSRASTAAFNGLLACLNDAFFHGGDCKMMCAYLSSR